MNEIANTNSSAENFDIQTLMNLTGQNALMMNSLSQQMGIVSTTVDSMRSDMCSLPRKTQKIVRQNAKNPL